MSGSKSSNTTSTTTTTTNTSQEIGQQLAEGAVGVGNVSESTFGNVTLNQTDGGLLDAITRISEANIRSIENISQDTNIGNVAIAKTTLETIEGLGADSFNTAEYLLQVAGDTISDTVSTLSADDSANFQSALQVANRSVEQTNSILESALNANQDIVAGNQLLTRDLADQQRAANAANTAALELTAGRSIDAAVESARTESENISVKLIQYGAILIGGLVILRMVKK